MGSDTVYCSRKGGRQRGNGWSKSIFLENKVAINFDFFITFLFSGHLDYPFQSYGPKQVRLISTRPWVGANKPDLFGAITLKRIIRSYFSLVYAWFSLGVILWGLF